MEKKSLLERVRVLFRARMTEAGLLNADVDVYVGVLSPEEAIGEPQRQDYPILKGVERVIEARVKSARGHAFTDEPDPFCGRVQDVVELPLSTNAERAIFIAVLNACLNHLGDVDRTVHCRNEEPEACAKELAAYLRDRHGLCNIGLIGCNPAILEALTVTFGKDHVHLTDLNPANIGSEKAGVPVWDGASETSKLADVSDVLVVTGTTLVNNTFEIIKREADRAGIPLYPYGVTAAGICALLGMERLCFRGHDC